MRTPDARTPSMAICSRTCCNSARLGPVGSRGLLRRRLAATGCCGAGAAAGAAAVRQSAPPRTAIPRAPSLPHLRPRRQRAGLHSPVWKRELEQRAAALAAVGCWLRLGRRLRGDRERAARTAAGCTAVRRPSPAPRRSLSRERSRPLPRWQAPRPPRRAHPLLHDGSRAALLALAAPSGRPARGTGRAAAGVLPGAGAAAASAGFSAGTTLDSALRNAPAV